MCNIQISIFMHNKYIIIWSSMCYCTHWPPNEFDRIRLAKGSYIPWFLDQTIKFTIGKQKQVVEVEISQFDYSYFMDRELHLELQIENKVLFWCSIHDTRYFNSSWTINLNVSERFCVVFAFWPLVVFILMWGLKISDD